MATLSSKFINIDVWAYDFSNRPVKDLNAQGNPQLISYATPDNKDGGIIPVTKHPTEYLDKTINTIRIVCTDEYSLNGTYITTKGIQLKANENFKFATKDHSSTAFWNNVMFVGDNVYIEGDSPSAGVHNEEHTLFSTETAGINVLEQTGIVNSSADYSVIVFEVQSGYKITAGNSIKVQPSRATGGTVTPINYKVDYDMNPGIYLITIQNDGTWAHCSVDYATTTTPTTTTPTTTTPTTPATTQLDTLKNSLKIPLDLTDDDALLNGYLNSAKAYVLNACDSDTDEISIVSDPRFQIAQIEIATLMYENRGSDKAANGFPYTLQVLINQLRFK